MSAPWAADRALSLDEARRHILARFPELAPARCRRLGEGWDNLAVLVDEQVVFRFPRRAVAAELIAAEAAVLPEIAAGLPLPISWPRWLADPGPDYPYPFAGYPLLPGEPACRRHLSRPERAGLAPTLGRFLKALHATPPPPGCPGDVIRRAVLGERLPVLKERVAACRIDGALKTRALARAEALAQAGAAPEPRLVHGDLYSCHLLVDERGQASGVIDWGDVHRGDPALDLSLAWALLPRGARGAFLEAYGPVEDDPDLVLRARFRALYSGVMLVHYGQAIGDDGLEGAGRRAIEGGLDDDCERAERAR